MPTWELNKELWKDESLFEQFHWGAIAFQKAFTEQIRDPEIFLRITDHLDAVMENYESRYESIKDPLFFWVFATVNALYLISGGRDMADSRVRYVLNGYREGLGKHTRFPSYTQNLISLAFDFMKPFADKEFEQWIENNRDNFLPVLE